MVLKVWKVIGTISVGNLLIEVCYEIGGFDDPGLSAAREAEIAQHAVQWLETATAGFTRSAARIDATHSTNAYGLPLTLRLRDATEEGWRQSQYLQ